MKQVFWRAERIVGDDGLFRLNPDLPRAAFYDLSLRQIVAYDGVAYPNHLNFTQSMVTDDAGEPVLPECGRRLVLRADGLSRGIGADCLKNLSLEERRDMLRAFNGRYLQSPLRPAFIDGYSQDSRGRFIGPDYVADADWNVPRAFRVLCRVAGARFGLG